MQIFIAHTENGQSFPYAINPNGSAILFDINKVSDRLKKIISGKQELIELTRDDMMEIKAAQRGGRWSSEIT